MFSHSGFPFAACSDIGYQYLQYVQMSSIISCSVFGCQVSPFVMCSNIRCQLANQLISHSVSQLVLSIPRSIRGCNSISLQPTLFSAPFLASFLSLSLVLRHVATRCSAVLSSSSFHFSATIQSLFLILSEDVSNPVPVSTSYVVADPVYVRCYLNWVISDSLQPLNVKYSP